VRRAEARGDDAVKVVDDLLHAALVEQASDIHLEPAQDRVRIRYRVDGLLDSVRSLGTEEYSAVLNRLKVLANMDISEKRVPQDGRFSYRYGAQESERTIDIRAAVLPTKFGERMTLRLLAVQAESLTLQKLGLAESDLRALEQAIGAPHGLFLLTGPTGSGKTTTLYAALRSLDLGTLNVLTIEDPIEYDVPGVSQIEVDTGDRITFARALRSVLRHDPDVLMIGEVRDLETAEVAIRSSLTGHLVLSTLHTNSALSAVTRLADMGVPRYLVAATLRMVVTQRLVRRLCQRCRRERPLQSGEARALGLEPAPGVRIFEPAGCPHCKNTGYAGRIGLFECFAPTPEVAHAIAAGASEHDLATLAASQGMRSLRADAAAKVASGLTSVGEAMQAVEVF
jgi:type IV pilus assembly protein PilB